MREAVRAASDDNPWLTTRAWICLSSDSFGRWFSSRDNSHGFGKSIGIGLVGEEMEGSVVNEQKKT